MTIDKEEMSHVITGPTGSVRGHRNRVIRSIQKIGYLSNRSTATSSSCSSASDTESDASSCSFSDVALSFTNSSSCESSAILSFEAEDSDVIRSLRHKWQRRKKNNGSDSGCSTIRSADDHNNAKEGDEVILYTTSIGVIRSTFEASNKLRAILDQNFIRFEERDLFLDESFRSELKNRFALHHIQVPCVFVNGVFFGSMEEIEAMNETGILRHILPSLVSPGEPEELFGTKSINPDPDARTPMDRTKKYVVDRKKICGGCGGARFIPCTRCNGSTKSCVLRFPTGRHSIVSLKCSQCSRGTGLIRCPLCFAPTPRDRKSNSSSPLSTSSSSSDKDGEK